MARHPLGTLVALIWMASAVSVAAAKLQRQTLEAWERYLPWAEQKFERETRAGSGFFIEDYFPAKERDAVRAGMRRGDVVVRKVTGVVPAGTKFSVPDGSIHHWWGGVLIRGATLDQVIRLMQDYGNQPKRFAEVQQARILSRDGDTFRFFLRLRRTKAPITVHYNTEHDSRYITVAAGRVVVVNRVTKIAELEGAGTPRERELTDQEDSGFLWRAVQWWRVGETSDGIVVESETASLGRDVPRVLRLIPFVMGYLDSVPRESIETSLAGIRAHAPSMPKARP